MRYKVGANLFVGENPAGYGLPERAGFIKKGLSAGYPRAGQLAKHDTDSSRSSSENDQNNAWDVNFNDGNGNVNNNNKNNDDRARAVLASLIKSMATL